MPKQSELSKIITHVLEAHFVNSDIDWVAYGPHPARQAIYIDGMLHATMSLDGSCQIIGWAGNQHLKLHAADPQFFDKMIQHIEKNQADRSKQFVIK